MSLKTILISFTLKHSTQSIFQNTRRKFQCNNNLKGVQWHELTLVGFTLFSLWTLLSLGWKKPTKRKNGYEKELDIRWSSKLITEISTEICFLLDGNKGRKWQNWHEFWAGSPSLRACLLKEVQIMQWVAQINIKGIKILLLLSQNSDLELASSRTA